MFETKKLKLISEGRERPSWLSEYEAELDSAIASLKSNTNKLLSNVYDLNFV